MLLEARTFGPGTRAAVKHMGFAAAAAVAAVTNRTIAVVVDVVAAPIAVSTDVAVVAESIAAW